MDLAKDSKYQSDILVMKARVLQLLSEVVEPGENVEEIRDQAVLDAAQNGGYAPGWCDDVTLTLKS